MKKQILAALVRFEEAAREHETKGGGHPGDYCRKEHEYKSAKEDLIDLINKGVS